MTWLLYWVLYGFERFFRFVCIFLGVISCFFGGGILCSGLIETEDEEDGGSSCFAENRSLL